MFSGFHYYSIEAVQIQELFSPNLANQKYGKIGKITYKLQLLQAIRKEQNVFTYCSLILSVVTAVADTSAVGVSAASASAAVTAAARGGLYPVLGDI